MKNKMQAMGPVMKYFGKLADGKQVNQVLKDRNVGAESKRHGA
jgi:hypothetical protein